MMTLDDRRYDAVRRRLQAERPLPPHAAADWEKLAQRIGAEAELPLAARRSAQTSRKRLGGFNRIGIPLAFAAGITALVLLSQWESTVSDPTSAFLAALAGETSQETVLEATLGQVGETWLLAEGR